MPIQRHNSRSISTTMYDATHGYDKNSNIGYLKRTTGGEATVMDELIYSYTANQLTAVADDGDATKGFKDKVNAFGSLPVARAGPGGPEPRSFRIFLLSL